MDSKHLSIYIAALIAALFMTPSSAQSLRCKDDLIQVGNNKATVLMKCGEPATKDSFCKPNTKGAVCETIEEWTYNPGPGEFLRTLRFESGKLISISYGDYGK